MELINLNGIFPSEINSILESPIGVLQEWDQ